MIMLYVQYENVLVLATAAAAAVVTLS